jgi:hypothetical protein
MPIAKGKIPRDLISRQQQIVEGPEYLVNFNEALLLEQKLSVKDANECGRMCQGSFSLVNYAE